MDTEDASQESAIAAIDASATTHRNKSESPTQLSIAALETAGYMVAIVEHYNAFARVRQDLFGFGDLLAVGHGRAIIIQTTTRANRASRKAKIEASRAATVCVRNGIEVELWTWKGREVLCEGWKPDRRDDPWGLRPSLSATT